MGVVLQQEPPENRLDALWGWGKGDRGAARVGVGQTPLLPRCSSITPCPHRQPVSVRASIPPGLHEHPRGPQRRSEITLRGAEGVLGAAPGWREGSGRCWGSAGRVGRGRVRVHGGRGRGMDGGANGVVGRLRGTDRQMACGELGGVLGRPQGTLLPKNTPMSLTWRRKSLCRRLRLGGSGNCRQSRSGERVPLGPNTLRSLKHSVSIIWGGSGHQG